MGSVKVLVMSLVMVSVTSSHHSNQMYQGLESQKSRFASKFYSGGGSWRLSHGSWRLSHGSCRLSHGSCRLSHGSWRLSHGSWRLSHGSWRLSPQGVGIELPGQLKRTRFIPI